MQLSCFHFQWFQLFLYVQHLEISHHINDSTIFDRLSVAISHYPASPAVVLHGCKCEGMWQSPDGGKGVRWGLTVTPAYAHCSLLIFVPQNKRYFWDHHCPFQLLVCYSTQRALASGHQC